MFFEINVSPKEKKAPELTGKGKENNYSLLLARFQPTTKIKLDCQINKLVECNITLNNTNQCPLKISITKTPPQERCLILSGEEWSLEPESSIILNIKWQPKESGSWRDILQLTDSRRIKYDVPLTLVCNDPHKKANGKAGNPKSRNMLGCRTNIKTQNVNNCKPPISNKINTQLSTKRTRSVASGLTDKENVPNNVDINWIQEQTIAKKQKKDQTPTESNFSKLLDSSAFKFTPIKSQLPRNETDKADASWIFSQESSLAAEKKTDFALRKETYITVPKFIHPQPSPEIVNNDDNKKCDDSLLPHSNEEVKEKPQSEISALFNDLKFTPLKDSLVKKTDENINFSPNFCSTVQKPKRRSKSIDEDLKNNSESKNATFSISSANNSEESFSKLLESSSKTKSDFHLKPTCLAATFDNSSINIDFSNVVPTSNNFNTLNNLKTPKRCSNVFSKSQADCGSLKDCLEADLWVKAKTSLSPITKILHSTLDSISEDHELETTDKDCSVSEEKSQKLEKSKNFRFEISPPKKHIFAKPALRKVSPLKSSKIIKDKSTSEVVNYKKKVQNSINCDKTTKKPVVGLIEKLSLAGLAKSSDKSKLLAKQPKEVSVKLHDPNDFLSIFYNPDPFAPTTTHDPFLASTHYYDDQWIFVQDLEFKKWLNALLSPPEHLNTDVESAPIDVGKIWQTCRGKDNVTLAETKESVSARYHTNSRLNILRKAAVAMYRKPEVVDTLSKTTIAIEKQLFTIRQDKDLHRDIGLQKIILELFICYNPLWLRIGLEAIYGETIPLQSNNDIIGLSRFILNRFFSDPFIVKTHSSTLHPNIRLKTFQPTINKFMLKKFLFLVYFLDFAKRNKLIGHDPCLFHKKAKYKSSRKILIEFSKELLSGIGDVTKVLKKYDYTVSHEQTYLDEYDYAVVNLCTDLKDGVRLCRVMELITGKRCLTSRCRVPAISFLQKIHNVDVALNALKEAGYTIKGNITAKNIAEGHKEKTMSLLWQIIYKFQAPKFEKAATTLQTWWRAKLWYVRVRNFLRMRKHNAASTIQRSWRCFLARRQLKLLREEYDRELQRKTKAAEKIQRLWKLKIKREEQKRILEHRDASALKIQRWWRDLKATGPYIDDLRKNIQSIINLQRRWRAHQLMKSHRRQFVNYRNSVVAVQRRWRAKRLGVQDSLNYQRIKMAIVFVQNKWRAKCLMKAEREVFLRKLRTVRLIQSWWRQLLVLKRDRNYFLALKKSVKKMEKIWIANHTVTEERKKFLLLKKNAIVIQKTWRNYCATKPDVSLYKRKKMSCLRIQSWWRSVVVQREYLKKRSSCIKIQKWWRSVVLTKSERAKFLQLKNSAIAIQKNWKMIQARRNFSLKKDSVLKIELWRKSVILTRKLRNEFLKQKSSARAIETWWCALKVAKKDKAEYSKVRSAVVVLQHRWRAQREMKKAREEYLRLRHLTLRIQSWYRMIVQKRLYKKLKERNSAALILQTRWRALKFGRQERAVFTRQMNSMIFVQRKWRSIFLMKRERENFLEKRKSAIIVQKNWRRFVQLREFTKLKDAVRVIENWRANILVGRKIREDYLKLKAATVKCQNLWRGKQQLKLFKKQRNSAIVLQKNWRRYVQQKEFRRKKNAIRVIENWRANLLVGRRIRENHLKLKAATVKCQNLWRGKQQLKLLKKQRDSAIVIQKNWRCYRDSKNYKKTKGAAVSIQKWIRHINHGKITRSRFVQLRTNVINLQRLWRMALQMKEFRRKRAAAVVIQKHWKRLLAMRRYEKQKIAVLFIENWRRHLLLGRKIRNDYLTFRRAVVTIQQHFRVKLLVRAYSEKRQAAVTIQRFWRSVIETRRCKHRLEKLKSAAVVVQRRYRANKVGEVARQNYLATVSAAFSLQRWWRGVLYSKRLEIMNKKKQWAVGVIETWYIRVREQQRILELQRAELKRLHDAATKIQTAWRGYRVRQAASKRLSVLRKRAEIAAKAATPSATLAFRLQENIEIFKFAKNIGELSICLASLDVITRLSPNACINVCQLNLVSKLYDILTKANRSLPWLDVCLRDISILLNLAKFEQTTAYVMKEESIEDLAKLLKISIDKKEDLFLHTATLIWILTENGEYLQAVKNSAPAMYLLTSLCTTNQRKIKALHSNVKQKGTSLPSPKPDWGLKHKQPRVFTNVAQAISCISSRLKILNIGHVTDIQR